MKGGRLLNRIVLLGGLLGAGGAAPAFAGMLHAPADSLAPSNRLVQSEGAVFLPMPQGAEVSLPVWAAAPGRVSAAVATARMADTGAAARAWVTLALDGRQVGSWDLRTTQDRLWTAEMDLGPGPHRLTARVRYAEEREASVVLLHSISLLSEAAGLQRLPAGALIVLQAEKEARLIERLHREARGLRRVDAEVRVVNPESQPVPAAEIDLSLVGPALRLYMEPAAGTVTNAAGPGDALVSQPRVSGVDVGKALAWSVFQPGPGPFQTEALDALLARAEKDGTRVRAGSLFAGPMDRYPEWVQAFSDSELREAASSRARHLARTYRRALDEYAVFEIRHPPSGIVKRLGPDILVQVCREIRDMDPDAPIRLGIGGAVTDRLLMRLRAYAEELEDAGLPLAGLMWTPEEGRIQPLVEELRLLAGLDLPIDLRLQATDGPDAIRDRALAGLAEPAVSGIQIAGDPSASPAVGIRAVIDRLEGLGGRGISARLGTHGVWKGELLAGTYQLKAAAPDYRPIQRTALQIGRGAEAIRVTLAQAGREGPAGPSEEEPREPAPPGKALAGDAASEDPPPEEPAADKPSPDGAAEDAEAPAEEDPPQTPDEGHKTPDKPESNTETEPGAGSKPEKDAGEDTGESEGESGKDEQTPPPASSPELDPYAPVGM